MRVQHKKSIIGYISKELIARNYIISQKIIEKMKLTLNYKSINKQMLNAESYEDIVRFVHENFFLKMSKWSMSYIDSDGDAISIDSDLDLTTMIETSGKDNMKIYIKDINSDEEDHGRAQQIDIQHQPESQNIQVPDKKQPVFEPAVVQQVQVKEEKVQPQPEIKEEKENNKQVNRENEAPLENQAPNQGQKMWDFGCHGGREMWKKKMDEKMAKFVDARVEALLPYIIKKVEEKIQNKEEKPSEPIKKEEVNHKIKCNLCGTDPIVGIRYKCTKCPLFNLCQTCEQNVGHNHNMIKMRFLQEQEIAEEPMGKPWWKRGHHHGGFNFAPPPFANNGQLPPPPFMVPPKFGQPLMNPTNFFGYGCPNKRQEQKSDDPRFKITKKCFKMSQLFGDEPKAYEDFVTKNLDLKFEELSQLYVTMNDKVGISKESNSKIQEKAKKLSFYFGKPAEHFTQLVSKNPASNFRQLIILAKQSPIKQPEQKVQKSQKQEMSMNEGLPVKIQQKVEKKEEQIKKPFKFNIQKRNQCVLQMKELFGDENVFDYINFYNANNQLSNEEIIQKFIEGIEHK